MSGPELIVMAAVAVSCLALGWYGRGILKNLQYSQVELMVEALGERKLDLEGDIRRLEAERSELGGDHLG